MAKKKRRKIQACEIVVSKELDALLTELREQSKAYDQRAVAARESTDVFVRSIDASFQRIAADAEQHPDALPNTLAMVRSLRAAGLWPHAQPEGQANDAARAAQLQEHSALLRELAASALQTIATETEQHPDIFPHTLATVRRLRACGLWPEASHLANAGDARLERMESRLDALEHKAS